MKIKLNEAQSRKLIEILRPEIIRIIKEDKANAKRNAG